MKYLVMELQKTDSTVSNIVTAYDERPIAEQAFFMAVAAACVSQVPVHTILMMDDEGRTLEYRSYKHTTPELVDGV